MDIARPTVAHVVYELTPALRAVVDRLKQQQSAIVSNDLAHRRELGKYLRQVQDDPEQYGTDGVAQMATELGLSISTVYKLGQFYDEYSKDDRYAELIKTATDSEGTVRIQWAHVVHLMTIDASKRIKLIRDTVVNRWSVEDLKRATPATHTGRQGRAMRVPNSPEAGVRDLVKVSTSFLRRVRDVWSAPDKGVFAQLDGLTADDATPAILDGLQQTVSDSEAIATAAKQTVTRAKQLLSKLNPSRAHTSRRPQIEEAPAEELQIDEEDPGFDPYDNQAEPDEDFADEVDQVDDAAAMAIVDKAMRRRA